MPQVTLTRLPYSLPWTPGERVSSLFAVGKVNAGTGTTTDLTISGFGTPGLVEIWVIYANADSTGVSFLRERSRP